MLYYVAFSGFMHIDSLLIWKEDAVFIYSVNAYYGAIKEVKQWVFFLFVFLLLLGGGFLGVYQKAKFRTLRTFSLGKLDMRQITETFFFLTLS